MEDKVKKELEACIDCRKQELCDMADQIFDLKEISFEEYKTSALLEDYLEKNGFAVERGVGGLPTAFRAVFENGTGGISIGLLCEYDALKALGHGCAHHMQGPGILGAACALKECFRDTSRPYKLVVYGTPGEETSGGKKAMIKNGCFQDIDIALMIHGGNSTQTDVKSMALISAHVIYRGVTSHAAISPEKGRSALDAMILTFNGTEFLREHLKDDTRIHYTVTSVPGSANAVPAAAEADFDLRSYNSIYLDEIIRRFENVVKGACIMTDTQYEIQYGERFESKVPARKLNQVIMANAELVNAPTIRPSREKTGSTDFGNVTFLVPGTCLRIAFVDEGTPSHSQAFIDAGKSQAAHDAIVCAAKIIAMSAYDLISTPSLAEDVKAEFLQNKKQMED